ncbi:MAG: amino acid permease [Phyllobacteriaceae bacterium]|nr:amino acid permease [Phyllobacteriaceae bacterium]MBA92014.1 amino acid permease [Phyllobacteriaceae bacterium]
MIHVKDFMLAVVILAHMNASEKPALRRTLTLPLLVFYGVGVTVGAGIFALIGEILSLAGDKAPLAFLLAGLIAGATGFSYALLVRVFPRAGGEAVFVNRGLGTIAGRLAGLGVVITGIVSSAVIALAFAGYVQALIALPAPLLTAGVVLLLAFVAWWGVRESVIFAAVITLLEVGTLVFIILSGMPLLANADVMLSAFTPVADLAVMAPVLSGAVIAFFAFIGFEDIENMAEETRDPERTAPRAILVTLAITMVIYVALSAIAVMAPDRAAITGSGAPVAVLFETVTGWSGQPIAAIAAIAMVNGILVQIVMAARVLYGMANEGLLPRWFAAVDPVHRTPARATWAVAAVIILLALLFPLVRLAEATSLVTLVVFTLVNLSLFFIASRQPETGLLPWRWWGLAGAAISAGLALFQVLSGITGGH